MDKNSAELGLRPRKEINVLFISEISGHQFKVMFAPFNLEIFQNE